jgi:hypothetical protein
MADNTQLGSGSTDTIATDDISGVKFQRGKISLGADGIFDGDVCLTNPMPVKTIEGQIGSGDLVDVTLSTLAVTYAIGQVLADTQAITGVMRINAGAAMLESVEIIDAAAQSQALDLVFLRTNVSIGTENIALSISDTNALEILGIVKINSTDYISLTTSSIALANFNPFILKSGSISTSIYVAAISRGTGTYGTTSLALKVGIVKL